MRNHFLSSFLLLLGLGVLWCCGVLTASAKVEDGHYYILTNVYHGKALSTGGLSETTAHSLEKSSIKTTPIRFGSSRDPMPMPMRSTMQRRNWP